MARPKSLAFLVLKCLVSAGLLYLLLRRVDGPQLRAAAQTLSWTGWSAACALYLLAQLLSSFRWSVIGRRFGIAAPYAAYLRGYFIGIFFNLFLPTGVGGDVVKGYHLGKRSGHMLDAAATVILDRVLGLIMLLLLGAYAAWQIDLSPRWMQHVLLLGAAAGLVAVALMPYLIDAMARWRASWAEALAPQRFFWCDRRALLYALLLSAGVQLLTVASIFVLGEQLHIAQPLLFYIASCAIIAIVSLTPLTINGFGVREWGFVALFQSVGVAEEAALLLSLLSFSLQAAAGLVGVIPFLTPSGAAVATAERAG